MNKRSKFLICVCLALVLLVLAACNGNENKNKVSRPSGFDFTNSAEVPLEFAKTAPLGNNICKAYLHFSDLKDGDEIVYQIDVNGIPVSSSESVLELNTSLGYAIVSFSEPIYEGDAIKVSGTQFRSTEKIADNLIIISSASRPMEEVRADEPDILTLDYKGKEAILDVPPEINEVFLNTYHLNLPEGTHISVELFQSEDGRSFPLGVTTVVSEGVLRDYVSIPFNLASLKEGTYVVLVRYANESDIVHTYNFTYGTTNTSERINETEIVVAESIMAGMVTSLNDDGLPVEEPFKELPVGYEGPLYCFAQYDNLVGKTAIKFVLYYEGEEMVTYSKAIESVIVTGTFKFNGGPWPSGNYKIDIITLDGAAELNHCLVTWVVH